MSPTPEVRPLRPEDVPGAASAQIASFAALDAAEGRLPPPPQVQQLSEGRITHGLRADPDGSWVAEVDGRVVGVGLAARRDDVWFLSLLAVAPDAQARGAGALLLERCLTYAEGTRAQYLCSSGDPRALRRYGRAGFALHPGLDAWGAVDRSLLPQVDGVREGDWGRDGERVEARARAARGAPYGPDLERLALYRLFVAERGVAVVRPGRVVLVSGEDEDTCTRLLWTALAEAGEQAEVDAVLPGEQWAVQVLLAAGLPVRLGGGVAVRGMPPPRRHLPSGVYG